MFSPSHKYEGNPPEIVSDTGPEEESLQKQKLRFGPLLRKHLVHSGHACTCYYKFLLPGQRKKHAEQMQLRYDALLYDLRCFTTFRISKARVESIDVSI